MAVVSRPKSRFVGLFRIDAQPPAHKLSASLPERMKRSGRNRLMPEGYCVKCKASKEIAETVEVVMKNGRKAIKGKCPTCGTVMFKILGGKAVTPAETKPAPPA